MALNNILDSNQSSTDYVALRARFDQAIVAAANETHEDDDRYDAETIAQYIVDLTPTDATVFQHAQVQDILSVSKLSDEELASGTLTRDIVTQRLLEANEDYFTAQRLELRAHLHLMCVWG